MIEKNTKVATSEVFTIHDAVSDDTHVYTLTTDTAEVTSLSLLDQTTAGELISQEQARLLTHEYSRRRVWAAGAAIGTAVAALSATVNLILDSDTYSTGTILGGSGIVGGATTTIGILCYEFMNLVNKRVIPSANEGIQERIDILKSNTDWS